MSSEVYIYFLNKQTFGLFLNMHTIFNAFVVLCGLILVVLAYNMKRKEVSYLREKAITDENSKEKEEKTQEIKEIMEEKPAVSSKTLLAAGNTVHLKDCSLAQKAKETRIVNERYAKAQKMKECKTCKPYSSNSA